MSDSIDLGSADFLNNLSKYQTRGGGRIANVCYPSEEPDYPYVVLVEDNGGYYVSNLYQSDGSYLNDAESPRDIIRKPRKLVRYLGVIQNKGQGLLNLMDKNFQSEEVLKQHFYRFYDYSYDLIKIEKIEISV